MNRALEGIRIADFSWLWAGDYATELLAFLGAEVIKIESKNRVDGCRLQSLTTGQVFTEPDRSPVYNHLNLNKLDVTIDLKTPEGMELAKKVIGISDVVMQNMRPGVMDRLGLSYNDIVKVKPDIIYLASSACGSTGPEKAYSGYAPNFAALGGVANITGYSEKTPSYMTGEVDLLSATAAAYAILVGLNHRAVTGEGQFIDLSSTEVCSSTVGDVLMDYIMNGNNQSARGNSDDIMAPHNCYPANGKDRWISIAVATDDEWQSLCNVMGNPSWAMNGEFADAYSRWKNQSELDNHISQWTQEYSSIELMEKLQDAGVAAVPSFDAKDLYEGSHLKERGFWNKVNHPVIGEQVVLAPPWKLSGTPAEVTSYGPLLGEHNRYVFGKLLGISDQEIEELVKKGAI